MRSTGATDIQPPPLADSYTVTIMTFEQLKEEWNAPTPAIQCRTSGSTGVPSVIELQKEQMRRSALRTCAYFGLDSTSHLHSCIAADFIGGKMMLVRAETIGASFSYETPSNRPLDNYSGPAIDLLSVVPSQMLHILDNRYRMPQIRNILIGGAPVSAELRARIAESGYNAFESYGMTETSSHIAIRKIEAEEHPFRTLDGIRVDTAEHSRLAIHIDGWQDIVTNDVAELYSDREFRILGRADNVIISGGKKIHPEQMERKMASCFSFPFYISSRPDPKWGERVVMVIATEESGISGLSDSEIIAECRKVCLPYEVPKEVIRIPSLPTTENGKLRRLRF